MTYHTHLEMHTYVLEFPVKHNIDFETVSYETLNSSISKIHRYGSKTRESKINYNVSLSLSI